MSVENLEIINEFYAFLVNEKRTDSEIEFDKKTVQQYLEYDSKGKLRDFLGNYTSENMQEILNSLLRYFIFSRQDNLAAEVFKIADGYNIPDVFFSLLEKEGCPANVLDYAFSSEKPPQYAKDEDKTEYIYNAHEKLKEKADPLKYKKALFELGHGLGNDLKPNKVFHKKITEENIDEYLRISAENHYKGYTGYFIDLYKNNPELKDEFLQAVERLKEDFKTIYDPQRKVIINPKWPYDPISYYRESDPAKKRYALCHCPWARNAIKENRIFDKSFCECSVGFNRKTRFGDIEGELAYEILETVLNGGSCCSFEFDMSEYFES